MVVRCETISENEEHTQTMLIAFLLPEGKNFSGEPLVQDLNLFQIKYRFDKEPHGTILLEELRLGNGVGLDSRLLKSNIFYEFVQNLMTKDRFLIRIPTGRTDTDLDIDLEGLSEILTPNLEYCGVKF